MAKKDHFSHIARSLRARSEALRVPGPASKPRAAYLLGYCRNFSWMWDKNLWLNPDEQLARENAQGGLSLVRRALVDLADRVEPTLLPRLHRTLNELTGMTRVWEYAVGTVPIDPPFHMSEPTWRGLLEPAGRGLDGAGGLGPWFGLGAAVGQYQNELFLLPTPGAIGPVDLDGWPDIWPVVRAAQAVPVADLRRVPLLGSLVRLASHRERDSQAALLNEFINENQASWTYRPGHVDFMTMDFVLHTLDEQIQSQLGYFAGDLGAQPGVAKPKPVWDPVHRELWYRGVLVRPPFRFDAVAMMILDKFQNQKPSWPRWVEDPLPPNPDTQRDRLKDAIRTLNDNLVILRFRSDGKDTGVIWEVVGSNE